MTQESIPTLTASHEEYAGWLVSETGIRKEIKKRLGKESVHLYTEIDEEEKKVFLKECEKCELPLIVHHEIDGSSCSFMNYFETEVEVSGTNIVTHLNGVLLATQEGKENFSLAIMEEIEKLPEFEQAKTLLEELKIRTCICKKVCVIER